MPYPGLIQEDHKILGSEYCSGYTDVFGKWNTGFYCPQTETASAVFCCGTSYVKYCCTTKPIPEEEDEDLQMGVSAYHVRVPVFFAVFCGILAVVILLITAICFFCSCCFVYKKRRDATSTGLYRIQGSSSTVSALASIYSNQNNSSVVTTPLDSDWTLNTLPISSYPTPYPFSQSITSSSASAFSPYPNSNLSPVSAAAIGAAESNFSTSANNNNNLPNFYYNNLTSRSVNNGQVPSLYSYGNLNQRPLSALSTLSGSTVASSNSTFSYGRQYPRQNSTLLHQPSNAYGFPTANNLPLSQQAYVYRHQQSAGLRNNNAIGQTHGSLRAPFSINQGTNGVAGPRTPGQNHSTQAQSNSITGGMAYGNRVVQNNTYQQRQNSNSLPYGSNNGGPGGGNGLIRSSNSNRTQGNLLNQQQQQLNQVIFAAIQSLIGTYRGSNGGPNALVPPSQASTTSGVRPNSSLSSSDINRLNAINLRLSALNQNILRNGDGDNRPNTGPRDARGNSNRGNENITSLPIHSTESDRDDSGKENEEEMSSQNEESVNLLPPSSNNGDGDLNDEYSPALQSQSSKVISEEESTENRVSSSLDEEDKKKTGVEESRTEMRHAVAVPSCNSEGSGESGEKAGEKTGQDETTRQPVDSYGSIEVGIHKDNDGESEPTTTSTANILEPDKISILVEQCSDHKAEPNNVNDSLHQKNKDEKNKLPIAEQQEQVGKIAEIQELLCDDRPTDREMECTQS